MTLTVDSFHAVFWTAWDANDPRAAHHVIRIMSCYFPADAAALRAAVIETAGGAA